MGTVKALKVASSRISLIDAYRSVIADCYNAGSTFDRNTVLVMIGFLAAAILALRVAGDEHWAHRFQRASDDLHRDWKSYIRVVPELCSEIDGR